MQLIDLGFLGLLQVKSPKAFNQRIYSLIKDAMNIKGDLTVAPIDEAAQVHITLLQRTHCMSDGSGIRLGLSW